LLESSITAESSQESAPDPAPMLLILDLNPPTPVAQDPACILSLELENHRSDFIEKIYKAGNLRRGISWY
jgi:hypothetical protein